MMKRTIVTGLVGFFLISNLAIAEPITFTSDTQIVSGNTTYDGRDIVIAGCVVTISGSHTFNSVLIKSGGNITHPAGASGVNLTVLGDMTVDAGGSVNVDGKGYGQFSGPGAGGGASFSGGGGGYTSDAQNEKWRPPGGLLIHRQPAGTDTMNGLIIMPVIHRTSIILGQNLSLP